MKLYKMNEMIGNDHKFINLAGIFKTLVICYFKIFIIKLFNEILVNNYVRNVLVIWPDLSFSLTICTNRE